MLLAILRFVGQYAYGHGCGKFTKRVIWTKMKARAC